MNKFRRSEIKNLAVELDRINEQISELKNQEEEAFEALPENFQDGERGDAAQEAIQAFEDAIQCIDAAIFSLSDASGD